MQSLLVLLLALAPFSTASDVNVTLYAEALCPFCAKWVATTKHLFSEDKLGPLIEFRYVAYGNVRVNASSGELMCQHGPHECALNRVINCAQAHHPDWNVWLPFVRCIEEEAANKHDAPDVENIVMQCGSDTHINGQVILDCSKGEQGNTLEREAGEETAALRPQHRYVPWLVVNGIALGGDYESLYKFVCVATAVHTRPDICFENPDPPEGDGFRSIFTSTFLSA